MKSVGSSGKLMDNDGKWRKMRECNVEEMVESDR